MVKAYIKWEFPGGETLILRCTNGGVGIPEKIQT